MPPLQPYSRELSYSYALGLFPALEAVRKAPGSVTRVLLHSRLGTGEGAKALLARCALEGIRTETADRMLRRLSGKENCFAAAVFAKAYRSLEPKADHLVLVSPMDAGNLGTILRTALGFDFRDIALIRPCADPFDPQVVRAGMGAVFSLRIREYRAFGDYLEDASGRALYPFMLGGAVPLDQAASDRKPPFSLVFGNEGSGLPSEFARLGTPVRIPQTDHVDSLNLAVAAAVGMYAFSSLVSDGHPDVQRP